MMAKTAIADADLKSKIESASVLLWNVKTERQYYLPVE